MSDQFRLLVFRVEEGLGNACAVELPDGRFSIIDWGTQDPGRLSALVAAIGQAQVAFVAATHAHADHTLGLPNLLEALSEAEVAVERFVFPANTLHKETAALSAARRTAKQLQIPQHALAVSTLPDSAPPILACGSVGEARFEVRVLAPEDTRIGASEVRSASKGGVAGNETSLVLLCRFLETTSANGRILLPGDATPATLGSARAIAKAYEGLELDNSACVIPHHGSRANLPRWMDPHLQGLALISCPTNSSHHPDPDVLTRLAAREPLRGSGLFCTSYSQACQRDCGHNGDPALVRPGACFGDLEVEASRQNEARVLDTGDSSGFDRRRFGYCA